MAIQVNLDVMLARRKMTLSELASKVDITLANLSVLKTGRARAIRFSTLDRLCRALDCQPGDLLAYVPGRRKHDKGAATGEKHPCRGALLCLGLQYSLCSHTRTDARTEQASSTSAARNSQPVPAGRATGNTSGNITVNATGSSTTTIITMRPFCTPKRNNSGSMMEIMHSPAASSSPIVENTSSGVAPIISAQTADSRAIALHPPAPADTCSRRDRAATRAW